MTTDCSFEKSVLAAAPVAILVFGQDRRISYANPLAESLFDNRFTKPGTLKCGDFISCANRYDDPKGCGYTGQCPICPLYQSIENALTGDMTESQQGKVQLHRDGGAGGFWLRYKTSKFMMDGSRAAIMTADNITEQIIAEKALGASEERFRIAKEASLDSFLTFQAERDRQGQIVDFIFTDMNSNAEQLLQMPREQLLGKRMCEELPVNRTNGFFEKYKKVVETSVPLEEEFFLPDTHVPKAFHYHQVVKLGDGIAIFHRDITERKNSENALIESEKKFRMLCDAAPISIMLFDKEGTIVFVNDWHIEVFARNKLKKEFFLGKRIYELPGIVNAGIDQAIKKILAGERVFLEEVNFPEFAAGHEGYQKIIGVPLLKDGKPDGGLLFREDLTQRKNTEQEQKRLESVLQQIQKMESLGTLASGIAHDFNNILFPILGTSEMMIEDFPVNSPEYDNAMMIYESSKRGSSLVKQILAFSRQTNNEIVPVSWQIILKEVVKLCRATVPSYIEIRQKIQNNCGVLMADPTHLHQIAMNLITNAFHAIEPNSGNILIQLKETDLEATDLLDSDMNPGKYVLLRVSDTGEGIHPDIIGKIFDPYFTTKEQGKGTGLGLSVVYGIVKGYRGDIKVYSEIAKGTTFNVYLPIIQRPVNDIAEIISLSLPNGNERILLVDDEKPIIDFMTKSLSRLGYKVTSRLHSGEALEAFKANKDGFDLVISDMTMPHMTGVQLAKELIATRPDIPIIICTGFSDNINESKAKTSGIRGFLMKPVVRSEMAQMVRNVLDNRDILL